MVRVALPPAVTDVGLSDAVAPVGRPLALSEIDSALPLVTAVEIVDVPEPPAVTETLAGLALIEKSLATGAVTVRLSDAVAVEEPVAVKVTVEVPVGVAEPAATITDALEPAARLPDAGDAVAPEGRPLTLQENDAVPPLWTVTLPELPWAMLSVEGETEMAVVLTAAMVTETVAECEALPSVPVTVRV